MAITVYRWSKTSANREGPACGEFRALSGIRAGFRAAAAKIPRPLNEDFLI